MKVVVSYRAILERSGLPKRLTGELDKLFQQFLSHAHSKTRVTANAISIKTQERRLLSLIAGFKELRRDALPLRHRGISRASIFGIWLMCG